MFVDWSFVRFFKKVWKHFSSLPKRDFAAMKRCENVRLAKKTGSKGDTRNYVKRFGLRSADGCGRIDVRLWHFGVRPSHDVRRDRLKNVELRLGTFP